MEYVFKGNMCSKGISVLYKNIQDEVRGPSIYQRSIGVRCAELDEDSVASNIKGNILRVHWRQLKALATGIKGGI